MRVAKLRIEGFRGIRDGEFVFHRRTAIVGPNGCGKSTIVDALSLVLGKSKMVRNLTEHDFTGSCPKPSDRFKILATITDFSSDDPDDHADWFRMGRAVPKWMDTDGTLRSSSAKDRRLAGQIGFAARFDHTDLTVDTVRYFHDDDDVEDPFADDVMLAPIPIGLLGELGYFVLPARRTWEGVTSFNSELFRRTISDVAGIPASEILQQRDDLRAPVKPLENSPVIGALVDRMDKKLASLMVQKLRFRLRVTSGDSEAVLQAILPHYTTDTTTLPASRHGMGLVSLQSLLLLLEVGRSRKEKGLPFILALEEPELHLAPGVQVRLVSEAAEVADQVICATHSPRVGASFAATDIFVMSASNSSAATVPFLAKPLDASATNNDRKLFVQNRVRVLDALMHPVVLVPEGIASGTRDTPQARRFLARIGERNEARRSQSDILAPTFGDRPKNPAFRAGWFDEEVQTVAVGETARSFSVSNSYGGQALVRMAPRGFAQLDRPLIKRHESATELKCPTFRPTFEFGC